MGNNSSRGVSILRDGGGGGGYREHRDGDVTYWEHLEKRGARCNDPLLNLMTTLVYEEEQSRLTQSQQRTASAGQGGVR